MVTKMEQGKKIVTAINSRWLVARVLEWAGVNSVLKVVAKSSQSKNLDWSTFSVCCPQRKIQAVHLCVWPDFMYDIAHAILVCSSGNSDRQSQI